MGSGRKHLAFLKSQINIMNSDKAFHNTTLMCRNGVFSLNSLLTFLLFKEELASIEHGEEDLVVLLPDVDVEVIRDNLDTLLAGPSVVGGISSFSLLLPYQSSVQPLSDEKRGRRSVNRTGHVCKVCGKYFKRTRWEAGAHDLLHRAVPGKFCFNGIEKGFGFKSPIQIRGPLGGKILLKYIENRSDLDIIGINQKLI